MTGVEQLDAVFTKSRADGRAALIVYLVAGDPDAQTTLATIAAISPYVDVIELGIPYGDPLADGPTIAAAAGRALERGMTMQGALDLAGTAVRAGSAPILLFTYVNPVVAYGAERLAREAAAAGVVGAIVPDVPLEERASFVPAFHAAGLAVPLLIAPTTPPARAREIAEASDGFVYIVSRLGVTGARREPDLGWIGGTVNALRAVTSKPLAVGFGISTPAHVRAIGALAHGVIVGSAFIDATRGRHGAEAVESAQRFARDLRGAIGQPEGIA